MGEGTADGTDRGGEHEAVGRGEAKPGAIEDANSQRVQGAVRAAGIGAGDDDQIESSLVSEFGAQYPGMGSSDAEMDEGSHRLFTDAMKLQLRAQILVLGDLLKGIAPNPEWLEDACVESAIGAESVLLEHVDGPRGAQDVQCGNTCIDDIPTESNLARISAAFRDAEARMSPFSGAADLPTTRDAMKDELHSAGRLSIPGEPSSSRKEVSFRDDSLAQETDIAPSGQLLITYNHTRTARSNSNVAEDSRATENRILENDTHLDLAQASAQDALTTATSALAQSHMVWARLHSQDHSEEGIARDARLASVAATVAAASSVAKAAVEAARAIAEVSMDAFIQASGYQLGDTRTPQLGSARSRPLQGDGWERSPYSNAGENATPSQQRAEMLESVVQAAGKAAEAASQAGAVLAKANPMIQTAGLSGFWSRKPDGADVDHEGDEANEMDAADEVDGFAGEDEMVALNEIDAINELDGANEEDAVEKMEDIQEEDTTYQDKLDAVNDVHEQVIANQDEAVEDDVAAAIGDEVANGNEEVAASGEGVVGASEAGVALVKEVEVSAANEDGLVGADEVAQPFELEKRISPRSRKFKRGRGRSRGVSSRAKRAKLSVGVSSPLLPAQSPEHAMHEEVDVSESLKDVRDESARGKKRGAKHMENPPLSISGKDTLATAPAQGPDDAMRETVEVLESPKNVRDRNSRAQKRGAKHVDNKPVSPTGEDTPATAPVRSPEAETHKQDDVSTSRKNARWIKRGGKHIENRPVSTTGEDIPATEPARSPENEVHKQDDISTSQKNSPREKHVAKQIENRPVCITGEDVPAAAPAQSPENEVHKKDDVLKSRKVGRGRKRGPKQIENRPESITREDIPATEPAESPENGVHKQDDVLKSQKIVRRKKRGAKKIENTPLRGDEPATAPAESPENEVHKQEDVPITRKNARGRKRGAKHTENRSGNSPGEDIPATAPAQSPENELIKKDEVPKSRKNFQDDNARGRTRSAKHIENVTVSIPGKDPADRDVRDPETHANIVEVSENGVREGSAVEVMIDEVGLRGGWFSGTVLRMTMNEVFVELHDLLTDDGKANVREWFPLMEGLNPNHTRRHARPVHPFTIFSEAGSRKRRRVALGSQTWHIGDQVDAFIQDAWWEGIVAEINDLDPTKTTVYFPEENDTQVVKTWDLRPSFQWKDKKWIPWKDPVLVGDEPSQKRHKTEGPNKVVRPDEMTSNDKSSEERAEDSRIQEASPDTLKSLVKNQQESKSSFPRLNRKKSINNVSPGRRGRSANKVNQIDVLSPGTSKHLDFSTDATVPRAPAQGKTPLTKGKLRRRRKKRFT